MERIYAGAAGGTIKIGRQGENEAREVVFDISRIKRQYGSDGVVTLIHKRCGDTSPYPCVAVDHGDSLVWMIKAPDTAREGIGECELIYVIDGAMVKSVIWSTFVGRSLTTDGMSEAVPEPEQAWVDKVIEASLGKSAYEIAVERGFVGSVDEWLSSLTPKKGVDYFTEDDLSNLKVGWDNVSDKPFTKNWLYSELDIPLLENYQFVITGPDKYKPTVVSPRILTEEESLKLEEAFSNPRNVGVVFDGEVYKASFPGDNLWKKNLCNPSNYYTTNIPYYFDKNSDGQVAIYCAYEEKHTVEVYTLRDVYTYEIYEDCIPNTIARKSDVDKQFEDLESEIDKQHTEVNEAIEAILDIQRGLLGITFTIDGECYEADEGMTFEEWMDSEYNTINAREILDGVTYYVGVFRNNRWYMLCWGYNTPNHPYGDYVYPSTTIPSNGKFYLE